MRRLFRLNQEDLGDWNAAVIGRAEQRLEDGLVRFSAMTQFGKQHPRTSRCAASKLSRNGPDAGHGAGLQLGWQSGFLCHAAWNQEIEIHDFSGDIASPQFIFQQESPGLHAAPGFFAEPGSMRRLFRWNQKGFGDWNAAEIGEQHPRTCRCAASKLTRYGLDAGHGAGLQLGWQDSLPGHPTLYHQTAQGQLPRYHTGTEEVAVDSLITRGAESRFVQKQFRTGFPTGHSLGRKCQAARFFRADQQVAVDQSIRNRGSGQLVQKQASLREGTDSEFVLQSLSVRRPFC